MNKILFLFGIFTWGVFVGPLHTTSTALGADQRDFFAVIVGVADYPGVYDDLNYTASDAISMKDALTQYPQWQDQNVELLLNSQATKSNIMKAVNRFGDKATSDDVFLFFFSGHGTTVLDAQPLDEQDWLDETICGHDEDIRDDELDDWLSALPTQNIVVIIDACHSGGQIDGPGVPGWRGKVRRGAALRKVLNGDGFAADFRSRRNAKDLNDNPGCIVITASNADQLSYEIDLVQHGFFTYYVLSAINNFHDFNASGDLSAEEIGMSVLWSFAALYVQYPWLYFSMDQFPQYYDDYPSGAAKAGQLSLCSP